MKQGKSPIGGHQVTKKEALRGLGDPKTWKKESASLYAEFRAKPKRQTPVTLFQTMKKKVKQLSIKIGVRSTEELAYAKSTGSKAPAKKKITRKAKSRKLRQPKKRKRN
jgi:hypothetical protein